MEAPHSLTSSKVNKHEGDKTILPPMPNRVNVHRKPLDVMKRSGVLLSTFLLLLNASVCTF